MEIFEYYVRRANDYDDLVRKIKSEVLDRDGWFVDDLSVIHDALAQILEFHES